MEVYNGNLIATSMIAFSTSLGVLIALISFIYQIKQISFIEAVLYSEIYISINLLFLYIIKRMFENED